MSSLRPWWIALAGTACAALVAACGGGEEATPTSAPPPTATRAAAPAPTVAQPTPTPTPAQVPTPIVLQGRRGGILQLRSLFQSRIWDMYDAAGRNDYHVIGPMFNSLIWVDPYGDGKTLTGDTAETWEVTNGGKTVTFRLRKGIRFHDGTPMTSKDVAYNLERAWKPRSTTMTVFKAKVQGVQSVEVVDDSTVRVNLSAPSNGFFQALQASGFVMYPAHLPLPESLAQFKQKPIGTGPYVVKGVETDVKVEYIRNDAYFKPGLPYLDSIVYTNIPANEAGVAAFKAGRIDATSFDSTSIEDQTEDLRRVHGFNAQPVIAGYYVFTVDQKAPFTDPRVREALDLAVDRHAIVSVWLKGRGTPFAAPILPTDFGGQWGLSTEALKNRPGYREAKAQDLARAKELLAQAGVDPTKVTLNIVGNNTWPAPAEVLESSLSALGFRSKVEILTSGPGTERRINRQFDISGPETAGFTADDPTDYLAPFVVTGGSLNWGKWSNPELARLFTEQDQALDPAKRRELLVKVQDLVLADRAMLPGVWRRTFVGSMGWVRNFPPNLIAVHSPWFRWEQVWLER